MDKLSTNNYFVMVRITITHLQYLGHQIAYRHLNYFYRSMNKNKYGPPHESILGRGGG